MLPIQTHRPRAERRPHGESSRVRRKLSGTMLRTVTHYGLVEDGDRILVAVSGGKDSHTLLDLLWQARRRAPIRFDLVAFHLDHSR